MSSIKHNVAIKFYCECGRILKLTEIIHKECYYNKLYAKIPFIKPKKG